MSGVRCGSRLDQLLELERQVKLAIEVERHRTSMVVAPGPKVLRWKADTDKRDRLAQLGAKSIDVKRWAVSVGLLERVVQGRVSNDLIDQYIEAHQERAS